MNSSEKPEQKIKYLAIGVSIFIIAMITMLITSCSVHKRSSTSCPMVQVSCISPGENGLSTYYLKGIRSSNLKGTIILIDDSDKYSLGDTFAFCPNRR